MAQSGWVYRDKYFYLDSEQSHEAWVAAMREEGWRVWMSRQTWDGTPCVYYGRTAIRHDVRRWFGPGPEPPPMPGPGTSSR